MAYLHDNQYSTYTKKKSNTKWYLFGLFIVAVLIFSLQKFISFFSYSVSVPVLNVGHSIEAGFYNMTHSKKSLVEHIRNLETQNAELSTKLKDYDVISNENSGFKNSKSDGINGDIVTVVAKPSKIAYDTLLIKSNNLINLNKQAVTISGVPLGIVSDSNNLLGTVDLYSSPGNEISAEIILEDAMDSLTVMLRGRGGGGFEAVTPQDIIIPIGSLVYMPNVSPKPFAEVVKISPRDDTKDQIVYFRSVVNFQYLRYLVLVN